MDLLCEELDALNELMRLLHDEKMLLLDGRADELSDMTSEKAALLVRLEEVACVRHQALATDGFAPDQYGMRAWLNEHPSPGAHRIWTEILSAIPIARERNRVNGMLISKRLSRNQEALRLLRGEPVQGMMYGADGQPKAAPGARGSVTG
jgi:flagella synthesis protein FlgN